MAMENHVLSIRAHNRCLSFFHSRLSLFRSYYELYQLQRLPVLGSSHYRHFGYWHHDHPGTNVVCRKESIGRRRRCSSFFARASVIPYLQESNLPQEDPGSLSLQHGGLQLSAQSMGLLVYEFGSRHSVHHWSGPFQLRLGPCLDFLWRLRNQNSKWMLQ